MKNSLKINLILAITMVTILSLSGCGTAKPTVHFIDKDKFEVNSKINPCDLISGIDDSNASFDKTESNNIYKYDNLYINTPEIDTTKLGKQKLVYKIDNFSYTKIIEIVDTKKPTITFNQEVKNNFIKIKKGEDIKNRYKIRDNYDKKVAVNIISNLNVNKVGIYDYKIKCHDSSNNTNTISLKIKVEDNKPVQKKNENKLKQESQKSVTLTKPSKSTQIQSQPVQAKQQKVITPVKPVQQKVVTQSKPVQQTTQNYSQNKTISAQPKVFRIADYNYDIASCERSAKNYGRTIMNSGQANSYSCSPYSENGKVIGFIVNFR